MNDIVEGLRWLRIRGISSRADSTFSTIRKAILQNAWNNLDEPNVLKELAETIAHNLADAHEEREELVFDDESRLKVLNTLVPLFPDIKNHIFWLVYHHPILVKQSDLRWLLERFFDEVSTEIKGCLLQLIERVFNVQNSEHTELIITASTKSASIASTFAWGLNYIVLNSPEADKLRERHEQMQQLMDEGTKSEETPLLVPSPTERINQYLEKFENGDLQAWWLLNREMTLKANSTHYGSDYETDLTKAPGWQSASIEVKQRILNAARNYLLDADPAQNKWLNKNVIYFPALAGYRALRLLSIEDSQFIRLLPKDCWRKWAAIILAYPFQSEEDDREFQINAVESAYKHAPLEIIHATLCLIDKENEQYDSVNFLPILERCWDEHLLKALATKVQDKKLKPNCMSQILAELLNHDSIEAMQFAKQLVKNPARSKINKEMKLVAARTLMVNGNNAGWETIWRKIKENSVFGRQVIESAASSTHRRNSPILSRFTETQLAQLYIWLVNQYSYESDPHYEGAHFVGPTDNAREFRDAALNHLTERGTNEAIITLKQLQRKLPKLKWLKRVLLQAQVITQRHTWRPYSPSAILEIASNDAIRLVQNGEQLLTVLTESLQRLETKLHGETPAAIDLWDETKKGIYRPKDENRLSDYIKRHLDEDLRKRGIIANREVEIRRSEGDFTGERTDIHIDAVLKDQKNNVYDQITVIIETKGCWHEELWQAMETQLKNRYLKDNQCIYGLYLVGFFNCSQWDKTDRRKKRSPQLTQEIMQKKLDEQAKSLSKKGILIKPLVLNTSLSGEE